MTILTAKQPPPVPIFPDHRRRSGRQADAGKMDPGEETQRGHFVLTQPAALFRQRNLEKIPSTQL